MKFSGLVLLMLLISAGAVSAEEQGSKDKNDFVVQKEDSSVFKGLLYEVWGRLRALNPQLKTNKTRNRTVATMGLRGAETTTTLIEPYWKGDKTDDPAYVTELTRYTEAQQFAEQGDLQKAVTALNNFLETYNDSDLKPNAMFALGISQGGMGKVEESKKTLQVFVDNNPKHPLVSDAKRVIAELN